MHSALVPGASGSTRCVRPHASQESTVSAAAIRSSACNLRAEPPRRMGSTIRRRPMKRIALFLLAAATLALGGCGYNDMQRSDEQVKAAWAEVVNQYQRRADLIPNLVNTVKGFAQQEQQVLIGVTEARAKATSIQVKPEDVDDP